jgi:hypothetical protein
LGEVSYIQGGQSSPLSFHFTIATFAMTATLSKQIRIRWEYSGLEDTVNVLMQINRNGSPNAESKAAYIRTIAYNYAVACELKGEMPTITGTGGWYVTFFPAESEEFDYGVEVTLMPYVVAKHLGLR